jgi:transcription elongation factor GreA
MQIPYRKPGKFSQLQQDPLLTQEKFLQLERDLDRLKNTARPQAAAEVKRLAELGDFSENAEYQLAKGKLRGINSRIFAIEVQLKNAVIIQKEESGVVEIGSTVTVSDGHEQKTFTLLGSAETKPGKGVISYTSPVGKALLGHEVGDMVEIVLPQKTLLYTILNIH